MMMMLLLVLLVVVVMAQFEIFVVAGSRALWKLKRPQHHGNRHCMRAMRYAIVDIANCLKL